MHRLKLILTIVITIIILTVSLVLMKPTITGMSTLPDSKISISLELNQTDCKAGERLTGMAVLMLDQVNSDAELLAYIDSELKARLNLKDYLDNQMIPYELKEKTISSSTIVYLPVSDFNLDAPEKPGQHLLSIDLGNTGSSLTFNVIS